MMSMYIEFEKDFRPDAPLLQGGFNASSYAGGPQGVINAGERYAPFKAYAAFTTTSGIGDTALGLFSFKASNNTYYTFGGIDDALKRVSGTTWDDVTGAPYGTSVGYRWQFAAFGDRVIATNGTDVVQSYLAGTDTDFSVMSGSPPLARYVTIAGDFVVLGFITSTPAFRTRVHWSAQGDPTASWASSATTQADYEDLDSNNGDVTGLSGFSSGFYVFQERAITRFDYVGSPLIFSVTEVVSGIGCYVPGSLVRAANNIFFLSTDGFKKFNGQAVEHIGLGRVDRTFWLDYDANTLTYLTSFADPEHPVVYWAFELGSGDVADQRLLLSYNYVADKWTYIPFSQASSDWYQSCGIIYTSTYPRGVIAGFAAADKKLGTFTGAAYDGLFFTKHFLPAPQGGRGTVSRVRILSEGASPSTVAVGASTVQYLQTGATSFTATNTNNEFTGRNHSNIFYVGVTFATWSLNSYPHGAAILEMTTDGLR